MHTFGEKPKSAQQSDPARSTHTSLERPRFRQQHADGIPSIVRQVLGSPGQPLDDQTRQTMESGFRYDFSGVRVHDNEPAARSAAAVNARAYTVGQHIAFGKGQYQPGTPEGKHLLAHELTHVVQQRSARSFQRYSPFLSSQPLENEASRAADAIVAGLPLPPLTSIPGTLQRLQLGDDAPPDAPDLSIDAADGDAAPGDGGGVPDGGDGGGAPDGGDGGAEATPAATFDLTARRIAFNNSGAPDGDNCAARLPPTLGAGIGGNIENAMEMIYRIDGTIPSGTEFDILRTRRTASWERDAAFLWRVIETEPSGTNDDRHNRDECLRPRSRRIFVADFPGGPIVDPRGVLTSGGTMIGTTATGFVWKQSFAEWVIARNRRLGVGWQTISEPTFTFWHSIHSTLQDSSGTWALANTPSGDPNEIALGSVSTSDAIP